MAGSGKEEESASFFEKKEAKKLLIPRGYSRVTSVAPVASKVFCGA
jgi:hypothetical protein